MKKKLLIFDLDGTLADTLITIRDGVNMAMSQNGFSCRTYDEVRRAIGNGAVELIRRTVPEEFRNDEETVNRVYADYNRAYGEIFADIDGCYPFVSEALHELCNRGYTIAVLSNKPDPLVKSIIKKLFADGVFKIAQGQTELPRKPDPTVPLMIAEQLGFEPKMVAFIGDSDVDIFTGKNAGMLSVGCSWGYRDLDVLEKAGADIIINSPTELIDVFK